MKCKTCKWYDTETPSHHTCVCPKMIYGYGARIIAPDELHVEDDEGWGMIPGPEFGCIHHEEK